MRILKENAMVLIIDFQERLVPHMWQKEDMIKNTKILIEGLKALEIPIIVSQQYTKGLGATIPELNEVLGAYDPKEKTSFSCYDEPSILSKVEELNKKWVIIAGIESHICVLQTTIDLIANGYVPVLIEDCISSRRENDKRIAIERMRKTGAIITTYESILFELCRHSGAEQFRTISKLVK